MGRKTENTGFRCAVCGSPVQPLRNGSYRNHCPYCLSSVHLDETAGDRASVCEGVMDAVGVRMTKKGWQVVHRCRGCGMTKVNRIAPDDIDRIIELM